MVTDLVPHCPRCSATVVYVEGLGFVCSSWAQEWCGWVCPPGPTRRTRVLDKALAQGRIRRIVPEDSEGG